MNADNAGAKKSLMLTMLAPLVKKFNADNSDNAGDGGKKLNADNAGDGGDKKLNAGDGGEKSLMLAMVVRKVKW